MKKTLLILLICFVAAAFIFTGCNQGTDEATKTGTKADSSYGAPGTWPIPGDDLTLTALVIPVSSMEDIKTNYVTKLLEERTGVFVDFTVAEGIEKVTIMFNSGEEMPDMFLGGGIDYDTQYLYGTQGLILPMNDLIEKYTTNTKALLEKYPVYKMTSTRPDGEIYALSSYEECYHCMSAQKMYINVKWLEALGLDMPTTTEEFKNVLQAFKDEDPNGNGIADELPLSGAINSWHINIDGFLGSAFIYNDGARRLNIEDGTIIPAFIQPEWREALSYINSLFAADLIDEQIFVQDSQTLTQLVEGEISRVGAIPAGHSGVFASTSPAARVLDYDAVPPLTGPNGYKSAGYYPPTAKTSDLLMITKYCEDPELAIRWADYLFDKDLVLSIEYGEEGVDWQYASEGEFGKDGTPALFNTMGKPPIYESPVQNKAWVHTSLYLWPQEVFEKVAVIPDTYDHHYMLTQQTMRGYMDASVREVLPGLSYEAEDGIRIATLRQQTNDFVNESIAKFVTGDLDINDDAAWQNYLDTLEDLNLTELLEIEQKTYDKVMK